MNMFDSDSLQVMNAAESCLPGRVLAPYLWSWNHKCSKSLHRGEASRVAGMRISEGKAYFLRGISVGKDEWKRRLPE